MSAPRSRRAALRAGAAVVGALCVPALAIAAPAVDLDAELFALLDRWREIQDGRAATDAAYDAAMARAVAAYPPMPAALWSGIGDQCLQLPARPTDREKTASGVRMFFCHGDVEKLRDGPPVMRWADTGEAEKPRREPHPEGEARRQQIIAASDRRWAERRAVEDVVGLTAATDASEAECAALNAAEDGVKHCSARTLRGLAAKAAWVADLLARDAADDDLGAVFAREVAAFGGVSA